ncbi:MAG: hypothetical protein WCQ95_09530 [Bacteroidota bacterium]
MLLFKKRITKILFGFFLIISNPIFCQEALPEFRKQQLLSGYESYSQGEILSYYSSYPQFAKEALLTRCTDGKKSISWKTASAPRTITNDFYYFYLLAGHSSGTSLADRKFDLKINGVKYLTFITPSKRKPPFTWYFSGEDSVAIAFEATETDIHKDVFGNMYLRVPKKILKPGLPLEISVNGQNENSNDWFMVFQYSYSEKIRILLTPLIINLETGTKQILQVFVDHIYPEEKTIEFTINNTVYNKEVNLGYNYFEIPIDTVNSPKLIAIQVKTPTIVKEKIIIIQYPVHPRTIEIIHHSHNDIGYSHSQEEVIKIQYQNILDALNMIDKTNNYPEGSRFIWNEETLWPIEYFLKNADSTNILRFTKALKNKRIVLTGFYAGVMTGLCSAEELSWIMEYAVILKKKYNITLNSAMLSDIPGLSWSITDAMYNNGIYYLSNGPNYNAIHPDNGDRIGETIHMLGDKPFYWKTSSGNGKILVWTAGKGYNTFHQIPDENLAEKIKENIVSYLNELDTNGYPYDIVQLRYTIKSDNGPIDKNLSDFVRDWNYKYLSPKLNISGVTEMMQNLENKYNDILPVYSGDFTPYWEDGAYSTANEEGKTRILSDYISQLENISKTFPNNVSIDNWFCEARKNIILFHEHTWGAWNSISSPDDAFVINQWNYKKAYIDSAIKYIDKIETFILNSNKTPSKLEIYNTLNHSRGGYIETKIPENLSGNMLIDESGILTPFQKLNNGNICFITKNIPANEKKTYSLIWSDSVQLDFLNCYNFVVDSLTGAIKSLIFKNKEFVNPYSLKGLNQLIYIKGNNPANHFFSVVKNIKFDENGPIKRTIKIDCEIEGANRLTYLISFFQGLDYIQLSTIIDKKSVREKEAMHVAFPFNIDNPINRVGISDTCYVPGIGQIPGSNHDFYSVQRWIDVSENDFGVTLCSPQGALFEIGKITDERPINNGFKKWQEYAESSSNLFLYALNNYWCTNFKADQQEIIRFDCYLQFHQKFNMNDAKIFGEEIHAPLLTCWK